MKKILLVMMVIGLVMFGADAAVYGFACVSANGIESSEYFRPGNDKVEIVKEGYCDYTIVVNGETKGLKYEIRTNIWDGNPQARIGD